MTINAMAKPWSTIEKVEPDTVTKSEECVVPAKSAVRLNGLWKTYPGGTNPAVKDLSLDVYDGEILTLLGPSGCGIEYQVEVDGQGVIMIYGERHTPIEEGSKVWLKLRPDGHTAWMSNWSHKEE
jgi:hypothetical protein